MLLRISAIPMFMFDVPIVYGHYVHYDYYSTGRLAEQWNTIFPLRALRASVWGLFWAHDGTLAVQSGMISGGGAGQPLGELVGPFGVLPEVGLILLVMKCLP